jgi:hypothetical protein
MFATDLFKSVKRGLSSAESPAVQKMAERLMFKKILHVCQNLDVSRHGRTLGHGDAFVF